ncbi:MAG: hypothetical protein QOF90_2719, partial [Acetobacteraceae bacterium]|nr:hypothetical protein [Acetobacteraceae bacterium]
SRTAQGLLRSSRIVVRAAVGLYTADPLLDGAVMVEQKRRARDSFHRSTCINYLKDNAANERMQ